MDEKATSPWIAATACSALIVIATIGGFVALRMDVMQRTTALMQGLKTDISTLSARVASNESSIAAVAEQAKPDTAPIDALRAELAASHEEIAALNARVAELEKAREAAALVPATPPVIATPLALAPDQSEPLRLAVKSGQPYAEPLAAWEKSHGPVAEALKAASSTGLPTDDQLRSQLRAVLDAAPIAAAEPTGVLQTINTRLKGLVSIHKRTDTDPTIALRKQIDYADIAQLRPLVEQLPDSAKAPYLEWLAAVKKRDEAYAAIPTTSPQVGH